MFWRKRKQSDFAAEIEAHLELETEQLKEQGLSEEMARMAARRAFGNATRAQERFYESGHWLWWDNFVQDLRFGLRMLRKNPGFTAVAVLTLALGIGANTATFSLVNAVLLRPLPLPSGERVAFVQVIPTLAGETGGHASPAQYLAWRVQNPKFDLLVAVASSRAQISGIDEPEEVRVLQVSPQLQELAGVQPYLGRGFSEDDFRNGSMHVCLISTRFWKRRFSEDRGVVGRTLYVDSKPTAIIGVLPGNVVFPDTESDIWIALRFTPEHQSQRYLDVYGRLRSGVSVKDAQAWISEATALAESEMPEWLRTRRVTVTPIREQVISDERALLLLLSGIAFCVLLICCANISNLLLARHLNRGREMALRASIGAAPTRLVRQLLTEAMLLSVAGTTAGFFAGRLVVSLSYDFLSDSRFKALIATGDHVVDMRVAAFGIFLSLLTTVLFGLIPSWHFTRMDLHEALKASPRTQSLGRGASATNRYLIAMEVAITFVLLTGAGLLVQSFGGLLGVDRGYNIDHLLTARLPIPNAVTLAERKQFFRQLIDELEATQDVRAVGVVTGLPLGGLNATMTLQRPGQLLDPENLPWASINCVNVDYFRALGIRILRGRGFDSRDNEKGMPVAVINETLARQFWPDRDALGQELMPGVRVIGIVPDIRQEALDTRQGPAFYLPFDQRDGLAAAPNFVVVRTKGDPKTSVQVLRGAVRSLDHGQPIMDIRTMEEVLGRSVVQRRLLASLMTLLAALAIALSVVGIYGVLSYLVSNRTQEIGIRMCLGARCGEILILLGRQMSISVIAGLLVGLAISLVATAALSRWLFAIRSDDPKTLIAAMTITAAAALLGCVVPAVRALRVDPLTAIRME